MWANVLKSALRDNVYEGMKIVGLAEGEIELQCKYNKE